MSVPENKRVLVSKECATLLRVPPVELNGKPPKRKRVKGVLSLRYPDSDQEVLRCLADICGTTMDCLVRQFINLAMYKLADHLLPQIGWWELSELTADQREELKEQYRAINSHDCGRVQVN